MATLRRGNQSVLLVVDVQVGVMREAWEADRVLANVSRVVARARRAGAPVVWIQHADAELVDGSADWQWATEVRPETGEPVIAKHFNSAFEQTTLEATLAELGATRLVVAGAATNWCIRATAYAALERGYDLTLIHDAHTTQTLVLDGGVRIEAAGVVHDLNAVVGGLSYPGRVSRTAAAEEVGFGLPALWAGSSKGEA
jgi:nicotinamidase-related amidase